MSYHADSIEVVGLATYGASASTKGWAIGAFVSGALFVYVNALSGTVPRVTPRWQESPNGNIGTGGHYVTIRAFATAIKATGLSVMTLPAFSGKYGRVRYSVAGTSAAISFRAWLVARGEYG